MQNRIAEVRKDLEMTQGDLARAVNVSRPYLSEIENGKCVPGGFLMLRIARALRRSVEDIFFDNGVMHAEQNHEAGAAPVSGG